MRIAIRRLSLASLGKFGCLLGVVAAFLPSLLCGLLALGLASLLHRWLEGWQELTLSLLGQEVARIDVVHLLGLDRFLQLLQVLTTASAPVLILAVLSLSLISGVLMALVVILVGLAYNLLAAATGGLVADVAPVGGQKRPE